MYTRKNIKKNKAGVKLLIEYDPRFGLRDAFCQGNNTLNDEYLKMDNNKSLLERVAGVIFWEYYLNQLKTY